jgi:hypothetical protein
MDIHPKFATWLASANITPNDETLRKWWAGLDAFDATASDVVSLVQLAKGANTATVTASRFHAALQKQDAALLPSQKLAVAALAAAKLHTIVETDSAVGRLSALLSTVSFPVFETQPPYRNDLTALAEKSLTASSRSRANLDALVDRLDQDSDEAPESGELERVLAVTAEETNILWWIFGGHSRDTRAAFSEFADEVIPFVAAKELADLTTILPGHVAVAAFADRVCQSGRTKVPQSLVVTGAIKKLPDAFVSGVSERWSGHSCLPLCRLTQEIVSQTPGWGKTQKLRTVDLAQLFYRECLVLRAWKKAAP